jgi:uncharacterized membrane protein YphA (DoxX/SURF4 family)
MQNTYESRVAKVATLYLRLALAVGFLAAVADRFGLWGPSGARNVAWGDFTHFLEYAAQLNPYLPTAWIPIVGWTVTLAETVCGIALLLGFHTRAFALLSGLLLLAFALGMTIGTGVKSAINFSVFSASGGAFLLGTVSQYPWSLDALRNQTS